MLKDMIVEMRQKLDEMVPQIDFELQTAKDDGYAKGLADGKAGGDANAKIYSQEEADALVAAALAGVPADTTPFSQADIEKAVADAIAALPADSTPFSQEDLVKAVQDALAALPPDVTPFSQADIDAKVEVATAEMMTEIADLKLKLSQKDTDALEEAIADKLAALAKELRDRTVPVVTEPTPEPVPETPAT